jgi:putative transposase
MTLVLKEHAVKKSRNAEEQIAYALNQAETGVPVAEVIMGISEQTFYRWEKLYGVSIGAESGATP